MIHFKVITFDIVAGEIESYKKAITAFNLCQNQFNLKMADPYNFPTDDNIDWEEVRDSLGKVYSQSRIIAVTSKRFSDNWFSHSGDNISVISTSDWKDFFSPPGLHCYLLFEFTLAAYFHASDISEIASNPHTETKGCLLDLCSNKLDSLWKLRVGYICSYHSAHFRRCGGSEDQLQALQILLDEVRRITLGKAQLCRKNNSRTKKPTEFNMESIKTNPIVTAAIIITIGISIGWGVAFKVWIEPKKEKIINLEKQILEIKKNTIKISEVEKKAP